MSEYKRIIVLIMTMTVLAAAIGVAAITILYHTARMLPEGIGISGKPG